MPADYSQGKVYRIISPNTDKVYIGSTTRTLRARFLAHVSDRKHPDKPQCTSSLLIQSGMATIELLEAFPCASRAQLEHREGEIQKATANCINKNIAGKKTEEERADYHKDYYAANKEEIAAKTKVYQTKNAEAVSGYKKVYRDKNRAMLREKARLVYLKKKAEAALQNITP